MSCAAIIVHYLGGVTETEQEGVDGCRHRSARGASHKMAAVHQHGPLGEA